MSVTKITIPYQNHKNKLVFDHYSVCCSQLNNVNFAENINDEEAQKDNQIYVIINNRSQIYFFLSLSKRLMFNPEDVNFDSMLDIWAQIEDITIENYIEDNIENIKSDFQVYLFDLKKFFSTVSFSSDYKERNNINLYLENDEIYYSVSDRINVILGEIVKTDIIDRIRYSFIHFCSECLNLTNQNRMLEVTNVDKNSFLLPYFNHKECLNFAVAFDENKACIKVEPETKNVYFLAYRQNEDKTDYMYYSYAILRKDKFNYLFSDKNSVDTTTGLWQLLVILQSSKIWQNLIVYKNYALLTYKQGASIYHIAPMYKDDLDRYSKDISIKRENYYLVGKLYANELFLLNKLFSNPKTAYFDFSTQKFIGSNYVFNDVDNKKDIKEVDFNCKIENHGLPLKLSFAELKHYIGSDLSQKDFILYIYTNGINVIIDKYNNDETLKEISVCFNHSMSKNILKL